MSEKKRDWDVVTGWEKRIAVDFGSIGPSHVRWSHWTYKERDIVARKVHESTLISQAHGERSKRLADWAKENEPIMIDFARDHKDMPDWAHAEYRESGVPEHVEVIWKREDPNSMNSVGDWAYDPPGPWDKGEEPPWSAKIKDPEYTGYMDAKYGGVMSYTENKETGDRFDTSGNLISTRESRAKEDIPNWQKFEVGRLEDVDGHWVPGPNALQKDIDQYGHNVAKTGRAEKEVVSNERPDPGNYITVGGIERLDPSKYAVEVHIASYPTGFDELVGRCFIADDSHVSMRVQEAAGRSDQVTVTKAGKLTFLLPMGYGVQKKAMAKLMFYFRKNNVMMKKSLDWWCWKNMPESTSQERGGPKEMKIMPDHPDFTPLEKALNWAGETHHGPEHQDRWRQISVSLGADIEGVEPMPLVDVVMWWKKFNKNPRWSMALDNLVTGDFDNLEQKAQSVLNGTHSDAEDAPSLEVKEMEVSAEEMDFYHNGPPVQGHFTIEEWRHMYGVEPKVVNVRRWKRQAIIDPALGQPNYWLEGQEVITAQNWDYENGEWKYLGARGPGPHDIGQAGTSGIAPTGTLATPDLAGSVETVVENCSEDDLKKILAMIMKKLGM